MIEQQDNIFHLSTRHTSYVFGVDALGHLVHHYYGRRVRDGQVPPGSFAQTTIWSVYDPADADRIAPLQRLPLEFPGDGYGSFYPGSCCARRGGSRVTRFTFVRAACVDRPERCSALPWAQQPDATLAVTLADPAKGLEVVLYYCVYEDCDVIARAALIRNCGTQPVVLERAMSGAFHLETSAFDCIRLCGRWAGERQTVRTPLARGTLALGSTNGESSHEVNPFFALARPDATEDAGEVYGFNLVYSGSWRAELYTDPYDGVHVQAGIAPDTFEWLLEPGACFETPQLVSTFTHRGLNAMSHNWHRFVRTHICHGSWNGRQRPLLLNSWETTYFDFDEDSLLALARDARALGVEMLVLDDGWFGTRNSDRSGLGDWTPNRDKLPGGLAGLSRRLHEEGMQFGLWIEPEMVNPDSDLYRAHPDWVLRDGDYDAPLCRNQLVLDYANPDVVAYLERTLCALLDEAQVTYVKWDMNRPLTCLGSPSLPDARQGETAHRYVLGLYGLLERLTARYPRLLIEGCSGGGGRFDLGMLCYCPQIWCSDNTDPYDRLAIQQGTSYAYPIDTMGCHVSASPNHYTGRDTPLAVRAAVAMAGSFGYELNLGTLTAHEREEVRGQIACYHRWYDLIHNGVYYRLSPPDRQAQTAWQFVSADRQQALVCVVFTGDSRQGGRLRLAGLEPGLRYESEAFGTLSGDTLMYCGVPFAARAGTVQTYELRACRKEG